jgi:hypothetical protein
VYLGRKVKDGTVFLHCTYLKSKKREIPPVPSPVEHPQPGGKKKKTKREKEEKKNPAC